MPLKVLLNLAFLVPGETGGMEVYARRLLEQLLEISDKEDLKVSTVVSSAAACDSSAPWFSTECHVLNIDVRKRRNWVYADQVAVPRVCRKATVDVVHSLASTGPVYTSAKRVTTVHDLHYAVAPQAHFGLNALGMKLLVPAAAKRSARIIADSQSTKTDIETVIGIDPDKIDVVHLAADHANALQLTEEDRKELAASLGVAGRPLVLSLSAQRPHKNLEGLIRAVALMEPNLRPYLLVPGYQTDFELSLRRLATSLGVNDLLVLPGWMSEQQLDMTWQLATAHVFPSFYEGFGLPALEALMRGIPSACSSRASLPEIVGDAALLFNPDDPEEIKQSLLTLLYDSSRREQLKSAGLKQAQKFSWRNTAELTVASYRRAVSTN